MKSRKAFHGLLSLLIIFCTGCSQREHHTDELLTIQESRSPAGPGSGEPNLFAGEDGRVYLSWIEPVTETRDALRFSVQQQNTWSQSRTVAEGDDWFVNWADFPSLVAFKDHALAAHWLAKSGEGSYAYDVNLARSNDGGDHWSWPVVPHRDGTQTEHGFVSMLPWSNDQLFLVWLDGRKYARASNGLDEPSNEMTLRFAMMDQRGRLFDERVLDERVCDCCPTSAVRTPHGALVVYRDRTETEIRDTAIVRFRNGKWSEPQTLYADNWEVKGCPVNGPAIAAQGEKVAVAWFTMANETPRVQVAFSNNEGVDFGDPIRVDDSNPLGRVDAVLLPDGAALVSWLETTDGGAEIRLRRIQPDGSTDVSMTLTQSSTERASGFPRMVRQGSEIYFAWTQPGNPAQVRTAVATLNSATDANSD